MSDQEANPNTVGRRRRRFPRSFKELTPTHAFNPGTFFYELVWKSLITPRTGMSRKPDYPQLRDEQLALTWIGHASFLIQFPKLNALIDPNFANWLFWQKRLRKAGMRIKDLPRIDLVLITHAHFDHFNKATLRRLLSPGIAVVPWKVGDLAHGLGFDRIVELKWGESFTHGDCTVTLTPAKHWGARVLHDRHRGYGGYILKHRNRRIYHAGDTAYFEELRSIGERYRPEIALLPIGACYPDSFRNTHMGPNDALQGFRDLQSRWMIPMHFGSFKLAFENIYEPPRWLQQIATENGLIERIRILEEGFPQVF